MLNNTSSKSALVGRWYFVSISDSSSKTTDPSDLGLDKNTPIMIFNKNNRAKGWETSSRLDERTGRVIHSKGYVNGTYKVNGNFLKVKLGTNVSSAKYRLKNNNKILEIFYQGEGMTLVLRKK